MIDKEKIIQFMRESAYKPLKMEELLCALPVDEREHEQVRQLLNEMEKKGLIVKTRTETYGVPERMNLVVGRLQGHPKGFGFVIPDDPDEADVFVAAPDMNGALHNDRVIARKHVKSSNGKSVEGEIIRILERSNKKIVGTFERNRAYGFVIPDEQRINMDVYVAPENINGAKNGDKVVVEIVVWPEKRRNPEGKIIEVLGKKGEPGVDITAIVRKYQLPEEFPSRVLQEAEAIPEEIPEDEIARRMDLRGKMIVTIDGEDAKDLDDAVSVERLPNGLWRLGVHIADVSFYVRENSELDREAAERGTSTYLVDRVIPMLPHRLSNGICSLNPNVDRLTLSVFMEFDERGVLRGHEFAESIIRTRRRMTYNEVRKILEEEDQELIRQCGDLVPMFREMASLCNILARKREERGAIDFDFAESKVILDENGKPLDIVKRQRSIAERIIEEFMLAANETVAQHMYWLELPSVYRVHEQPDEEAMYNLNQFLGNFGYQLKGLANIHPKALQQVLKKAQGRPEEMVISTIMLRSLKRARYMAENLGHFGLAAKFYTHFTSPIRRYPDLIVHRLMREYFWSGREPDEERIEYLREYLPYITVLASERERRAEEAERESTDLKKVEFMANKVGEIFEGIISGVTAFGFFVELSNSVEGLVHVSSMTDDYYHFNEKIYALIGERKKRIFRIGDAVKVQLARASIEERQIDFILYDEEIG